MDSRMIMFHVPEDRELLAELGTVTLRHEQLNHILKMTIRSITQITPKEAIDALKYQGSRNLRKRIKKLAKKELGDGSSLLKLEAILARAEKLTEKRNYLTHGLWAEELDGDPGIMHIHGELNPLPSKEELRQLALDLKELADELNEARFEGFLKIDLDKKKSKKA